MLDAARGRPLCGDQLAERFMDEEARAYFANFADLDRVNASNAVRHRILDDILRERLAANPQLNVVLLGAGFDTRAFRLSGGRWVELDHPALLARKDALLPTGESPNALLRIPIDFSKDRLADKLATLAHKEEAVVVMEGVHMYLEAAQLRETIAALQRHLPGHTLTCDLMDASFARYYGREIRRRVASLGGRFAPPSERPQDQFLAQGYRLAGSVSIVGRTIELGGARAIPQWLFNSLLRSLCDGYRVYRFQAP
jgi:methyltransferase (TIGR00027 family)